MAKQEFDPMAMDAAAEAAMKELGELPQVVYIPVARWFAKHYLKAGHKRLGRGLVAIAKETAKLQESQMTSEADVEPGTVVDMPAPKEAKKVTPHMLRKAAAK